MATDHFTTIPGIVPNGVVVLGKVIRHCAKEHTLKFLSNHPAYHPSCS